VQMAFEALRDDLASAITCLREIAAMGKKAGSERATQWLLQHGYPLEEGGYLPGKGFVDSPPPSWCAASPWRARVGSATRGRKDER
jgi:hypothetical protein